MLTNSDSGLDLTAPVVDEVAGQFGWPWTGWSTPLWLVLLVLASVVAVVVGTVGRLRRRMERSLPSESVRT